MAFFSALSRMVYTTTDLIVKEQKRAAWFSCGWHLFTEQPGPMFRSIVHFIPPSVSLHAPFLSLVILIVTRQWLLGLFRETQSEHMNKPGY